MVHVQLYLVKSDSECIFGILHLHDPWHPGSGTMRLDVHMYKYNDVIGTGTGRQLYALDRISSSATVLVLVLWESQAPCQRVVLDCILVEETGS